MKVAISRYGAKGVLLTWAAKIDETILREMTQFIHLLESEQDGIADLHHAYHEVLIQYKKKIKDYQALKIRLQDILFRLKKAPIAKPSLWTVAVCYDQNFAPDQTNYLEQKGITKAQLIKLHTAPVYTVYFTGFLPGFLYLGGLDSTLAIDRKTTPSPLIRKGTVAIGGEQTGVYPQDSPGGWHGIGYTPIAFFDAQKERPSWAKTGDKIRFESVTRKEMADIQQEIAKGNYDIKSTSHES